MERHTRGCRECHRLLAELELICTALGDLREHSPRAIYKLRLSNSLQNARRRPRLWARPLVLGVALAAALAVWLWPDQPPELDEGTRYRQFDLALEWTTAGNYAAATTGYVAGLRDYPTYSHAEIQPISY